MVKVQVKVSFFIGRGPVSCSHKNGWARLKKRTSSTCSHKSALSEHSGLKILWYALNFIYWADYIYVTTMKHVTEIYYTSMTILETINMKTKGGILQMSRHQPH